MLMGDYHTMMVLESSEDMSQIERCIADTLEKLGIKKVKSEILFAEYLESYLRAQYGGISTRTFTNKIGYAKHILEGLGHYKMYELDKNILQTFMNGFTRKTYIRNGEIHYYSQSLINKVYDILNGAIQNASSDENPLITHNFMQTIKKPKAAKQLRDDYKPFTEKQLKNIAIVINSNMLISLWVHIMIYTGVRPSEALALRFSDVNYDDATISIMRTLSKEDVIDIKALQKVGKSRPIITRLKNERSDGGFNYQRRTIKVGEYLLSMIKKWEEAITQNHELMRLKSKNGIEGYIFCGEDGTLELYDYYSKRYNNLLKKANIATKDYNPYKFRHTYCTKLLKQGVDIKTLQLLMGDNSPEMILRVYANMNKEDVIIASGKYAIGLDKIFCE